MRLDRLVASGIVVVCAGACSVAGGPAIGESDPALSSTGFAQSCITNRTASGVPDSQAIWWNGSILPLYRPSQSVSLGNGPILGVGVCFDVAVSNPHSSNYGFLLPLGEALTGLNAFDVRVDVDCQVTGCNPQEIISRPATPFRYLTSCNDSAAVLACEDFGAFFGFPIDPLDSCVGATRGTHDLRAALSTGGTPHEDHVDHVLFTTTSGCGEGTDVSLVHVYP